MEERKGRDEGACPQVRTDGTRGRTRTTARTGRARVQKTDDQRLVVPHTPCPTTCPSVFFLSEPCVLCFACCSLGGLLFVLRATEEVCVSRSHQRGGCRTAGSTMKSFMSKNLPGQKITTTHDHWFPILMSLCTSEISLLRKSQNYKTKSISASRYPKQPLQGLTASR